MYIDLIIYNINHIVRIKKKIKGIKNERRGNFLNYDNNCYYSYIYIFFNVKYLLDFNNFFLF